MAKMVLTILVLIFGCTVQAFAAEPPTKAPVTTTPPPAAVPSKPAAVVPPPVVAAPPLTTTPIPIGTLIGDPVAGQAKAQVCVACHSVDGNATTAMWPKIAGLSATYLLEQLLEFQKGPQGNRFDPSMYGIVQSLSQQDLADLAAYYSTQKMSSGAAAQAMVDLGQKIYRGGNILTGVPACAACHAADGSGNYLAKFPRLSGQNSDYISAQLNQFKTKQRKNDPNGIMEDISNRLTNEEIEAVASYVAGLH